MFAPAKEKVERPPSAIVADLAHHRAQHDDGIPTDIWLYEIEESDQTRSGELEEQMQTKMLHPFG
jgi:hypothetical protein